MRYLASYIDRYLDKNKKIGSSMENANLVLDRARKPSVSRN